MSRIRGKNTTPEKRVRSLLHHLGFRFRLHVRIPIQVGLALRSEPPSKRKTGAIETSRPTTLRAVSVDILLRKHKTAIFVHGCFWHRHKGCKNCTTPTNRRSWWLAKLNGNAARDKVHQRAVRKLGWRSIVVWECQTEHPKRLERLSRKLAKSLGPMADYAGTASRIGRVLAGGNSLPSRCKSSTSSATSAQSWR